jgi:hypothetical protein
MRLLLLPIILSTFNPMLVARQNEADMSPTVSQNGRFIISVQGDTDEDGFRGNQMFRLVRDAKDTLWAKGFPGEGLWCPTVSSRGDVAVHIKGQIRFFDSTGALKATHHIAPNDRVFALSPGFMPQGFSPSGDRYYYFASQANSPIVISLSESGNEVWRDTTDYSSVGDLFYFAFDDKILVYFACEPIPNPQSCCFLYQKDEARVWQYLAHTMQLSYSLEGNAGILTVFDDSSQVHLKLKTLGAP